MPGSQPNDRPAAVDPPRVDSALAKADEYRKVGNFRRAREILQQVLDHPAFGPGARPPVQLVKEAAMFWSKDTGLSASTRHETALEILRRHADLESNDDKDLLGTAGGIYKRLWRRSGQIRHLMSALHCYERGYRSTVGDDRGYNAINAAFMKDHLASCGAGSTAHAQREEAAEIRRKLLDSAWVRPLESSLAREELQDWWNVATVAEALLGLAQYDQARELLRRTLALAEAQRKSVSEEYRRTTATQLADLCRLHDSLRRSLPGSRPARTPPPGGQASQADNTCGFDAVGQAFAVGPVEDLGRKLGLALSGGGFRASLYHLGVLARLVDERMLHRVEVLSCVSGGSIVGAHYYLELRRQLEKTRDGEIDYVQLVKEVHQGFLKGVKSNIRTRALANWRENLRCLLLRQTRTRYLGELIESKLYANVHDGRQGEPRWIDDLTVKPLGEAADFHPRNHNWRRKDKVPVLILNATTLNTGHLWQFTATWMGEPPDTINPAIDLRERLRRLYYHQAPERFRRIRLGHAVAASSCVPGLFEPFELDGLYPDRKVRLVDGGVFDNQGINGLLAEECLELIVSDASGLLTAEATVAASRIRAPLRSNSISMGLVRERLYGSASDRQLAGSVRELCWVHLEEGVKGRNAVDWIRNDDGLTRDAAEHGYSEGKRGETERTVEEMVAAIRTDLDSFSEIEAGVLMARGYRSVEKLLAEVRRREPESDWLPQEAVVPADWPFLKVETILELGRDRPERKRLLELLDAGRLTVFKPWRVVPGLRQGGIVTGLVAMAGLSYWGYSGFDPRAELSPIGMPTLAMAALGTILVTLFAYLTRGWSRLLDWLIGVLVFLAWPVLRFHLHVLDKWFLKYGEFGRLRS